MIKIDIKDKNDENKALTKFKKKIRESKLMIEYRERQYFETNSQKRKRKQKISKHRHDKKNHELDKNNKI